jgi:hypothetical protein
VGVWWFTAAVCPFKPPELGTVSLSAKKDLCRYNQVKDFAMSSSDDKCPHGEKTETEENEVVRP